MRRKLFMLPAAMLIAVAASSQDSLQSTNLQAVVVSATRLEQPVIEAPRNVTVIDRRLIDQSAFNSVGELLSAAQGLYVVGSNQTPGTNQSLFMRGAASNQVAVMIDGVRITDPSTPNAVLDLSEVSLAGVERIEIIRGSHSTMYGGAAIGGVINIITRKSQHAGFRGAASAQASTFGKGTTALAENLELGFADKGGWFANGALFQQNVNGLDATVKTTAAKADDDDFRKTDAQLKAGFRNERWDNFVMFKKTDQRAGIDNSAFTDDDNNYVKFARNFLEYNVRYQIGNPWSLVAIGSFTDSERINENDSSLTETGEYDKSYFKGTYYGRLITQEFQVSYQDKNAKAILGAGLFREDMAFSTRFFYNDPAFPFEAVTNYDTINTAVSTAYVFASAEYAFKHLRLGLGSRYSSHGIAGDLWTVEENLSYPFRQGLVYASLSTGFNAPSLYQLFDPTKGFSSHTTRGNPELRPERSLSLEVGAKKEFGKGAGYITVSAYDTRVKNAIEYVYLWNGSKDIGDLDGSDYRGDTYLNLARQRTRGIEIEGHAAIGKSAFVDARFSLMKGRIEVRPGDLATSSSGGHHVQLYNFGVFATGEFQDDLTRRPQFTSFVSAGFMPVEQITLTLNYRHTGAAFDIAYDAAAGPFGALKQVDIDAYDLFDAAVHWKVSRRVAATVRVENVFDRTYYEIAGFQTRGRSAYAKLMLTW